MKCLMYSSRQKTAPDYKEYVISRTEMDCYHQTVYLPECVSFRPGETRLRMLQVSVRRSAVTQNAKELAVPYRSVNPATGEVLKTFTEHTDQEMMDALATADKAFVSWGTRPVAER